VDYLSVNVLLMTAKFSNAYIVELLWKGIECQQLCSKVITTHEYCIDVGSAMCCGSILGQGVCGFKDTLGISDAAECCIISLISIKPLAPSL